MDPQPGPSREAYKKLHLADSIDSLNRIAMSNGTIPTKNPNSLLNVAKKLYAKSQSDPLDDETTYILLSRFIRVYERLQGVHPDQPFVYSMLGKEVKLAMAQIEVITSRLATRYEEARKVKLDTTVKVEATAPEPSFSSAPESTTSVFNNEEYASCSELYNVHRNRTVNVLIMDIRSEADFEESHIAGVPCINIPGHCIQEGLSAHRLGRLLPSASKQQWTKRDSFDAVILVDWDSPKNEEESSSTKLERLRNILVDWDVGRTYNERPVLLKDGFREWLEMYPTLCSSSDIAYAKANWELDEMLDLEMVHYPQTASSKSLPTFDREPCKKPAYTPVAGPSSQSRDDILEEEIRVIELNKEVTTELIKHEEEWKNIHDKISAEYDLIKLNELKQQEKETEEKIEKLSAKEAELLEKKSQLANDFNLATSFVPSDLVPLQRIVKLEDISKLSQEHMDMVSARQTFAAYRQQLLDEARLSKKPQLPMPTDYKDKQNRSGRPTVNRTTKPKAMHLPIVISHIEGSVKNVRYGLTGLSNNRNTCYMNTIIQCLRHLPPLISFYCNGEYVKHLRRYPPYISNEVAHLVRALWSNTYSSIKPKEFYAAFTDHAPVYKQAYHEDCLEFFLQLFNYLSDDCAINISPRNDWSETHMSWYKQHCGKTSFFINMFYHQIRIQQACLNCRTTNTKFDIENMFYLVVPDKTFKLEDSMRDYMESQDQILCKTCRTPKQVKKTISYYPSILIVALKRHIQDYVQDNSTVRYRKNENDCHFPVDDFQVGSSVYKLRAISCHQGNVTSGHYTALCNNPVNNRWYHFNDEVLTEEDIHHPVWRTRAYAFFYTIKKTSGSQDSLPPEEVFKKSIEPDDDNMVRNAPGTSSVN